MTKVEGSKVRGSPQTGPRKFKLFNLSRKTHEVFRIGKLMGLIQHYNILLAVGLQC